MTGPYRRTDRVADLIQQALAQALLRETNDPRFVGVTVMAVNISPDLKNATIYISLMDESKSKETLAALNKAAGFFRHNLADSVELRVVPRLNFVYDKTTQSARRISEIIAKVTKAYVE